jgi:hypothetical protein
MAVIIDNDFAIQVDRIDGHDVILSVVLRESSNGDNGSIERVRKPVLPLNGKGGRTGVRQLVLRSTNGSPWFSPISKPIRFRLLDTMPEE